MSEGKGHPLPESDEARHNEIPEGMEREKGRGEEGEDVTQPRRPAVNPDGEPYRYDDLGRGPDGERKDVAGGRDEIEQDQREHQDRGQSEAEAERDS